MSKTENAIRSMRQPLPELERTQPVRHRFLIALNEAVEFYAAFISVSVIWKVTIEKIDAEAVTDSALFITIKADSPQAILEIGRQIGFYQRFPTIIKQHFPNYK